MKAEQAGIMKAAIKHASSQKILNNRLRDRITHGTKSGPQQYINNEEKKKLAVSERAVDYGKTRMQVMYIAKPVANTQERQDQSRMVAVKGKEICH